MLQRVNSSTVPKLIGAVLDLLDTDRLPQGAAETGVVSRGIAAVDHADSAAAVTTVALSRGFCRANTELIGASQHRRQSCLY